MTSGSAIMIYAYPVTCMWQGFPYVFASRTTLLQSPVYKLTDHVIPLGVLGILLMTCAIVLAAAIFTEARWLYITALTVAGGTFSAIGCIFAVAAVHHKATYGAPALPLFFATAAVATMTTLNARERTQ